MEKRITLLSRRWIGTEAFAQTLGSTWRIVAASLGAYLVSQNLDVFLFHKIRDRTGESKLYLRNILSTGVSQLVDTVIFIVIAFYGVMPIVPLIIGQYIIKLGIAALDTPFLYSVKYFKNSKWSNYQLPSFDFRGMISSD